MALSRAQINARNRQIDAARAAIIAGNSAQAQQIVNNLIGGSKIGGAQAALQGAINAMPAPAPPPPPPPPPTPTPIPPYIRIMPATVTIDGGGGSPAPAPTTVSYTPPPPPPPVKIPNRDVLNFSREEFSTSAITNLLFEQIGSTEIVNIARRDTIEGQNPYYSLISNLASIKREFDPTKLITKQKAVNANFAIYSIDLNNKIPDQEYLDRNNITSFFYIASNGDLVIELDNLEDDEIIDFEIANSGTINLVDEA
jgi:hypothetical protein